MAKNLGDIPDHGVDPIEMYYRMYRQGVKLQRRKWIKNPDFDGCHVEEMEKSLPGFQKWFECHVMPRNWELLADFKKLLECGTFFVKNPNWIEPPITARNVPLRTEVGPVSIAAVTPTDVLTYTVADRHVGSVKGFGNALCETADWARVLWTIKVNERPHSMYRDFRNQIGTYDDPKPFTSPIPLKHGDVFKVTARLSAAGAAADAWAHAPLFIFPAKDISQAGDYSQYHTI